MGAPGLIKRDTRIFLMRKTWTFGLMAEGLAGNGAGGVILGFHKGWRCWSYPRIKGVQV